MNEAIGSLRNEQFVYVIRDPETYEVRYIGRGKHLDRPLSHLKGSHNEGLNKFLTALARQNIAPIIEWAGPYNDEISAKSVEAALISVHWSKRLLNKRLEDRLLSFRSFTIPPNLTKRQYDDRLSRAQVRKMGGALVVYVNAKNFHEDRRSGALPKLNVTDDEICDRVSKWWQISQEVSEWKTGSVAQPKYLIGLTGPTERRWVFASMEINHGGWPDASPPHGLWQVPVRNKRPYNDAGGMRGRLVVAGQFGPVITASGHRRFNSFRHSVFDVI